MKRWKLSHCVWQQGMKELLHLDERPASWKVLLDCPHDAKICVIGVSRATDLALRRSFGMLDAGLVLNRQYDVVIVGSRVDMRHVKPDALIAATASHGTIVELWQTALARCLIDAGFYFSPLLPRGCLAKRPRLFIPLASRRLRNRGLTFHTPGSFRARLGLRLVKALSSLGWAGYLGPCTVTFYARRIATSQAVSFRLWLSERLGYEILDLAVYAGSNGPRRKITALAIADNAREDVVVKIADTQLGSEAITQESEALLTLARSDLSCQVPYVITEDKWNGYHVQVQQAVFTRSIQAGTSPQRCSSEVLGRPFPTRSQGCPAEANTNLAKDQALGVVSFAATNRRPNTPRAAESPLLAICR